MEISPKTLFVVIISFNLLISTLCWNRQTGASSDGGGDVIFLDRHNVYCNTGEALQGFTINSGSGSVYFQYTCLASSAIQSSGAITASTPWTDAADDIFAQNISAHRMTYIPIQCNNDYALQGFKMSSSCSSPICKIKFDYTCVPVKAKDNSSSTTDWIDGGDGGINKLRNIQLLLADYNVLQGWKLNVSFYFRWFDRDGRYFKYTYNFISLRNTEQEAAAYDANKSKPTRKEIQFLQSEYERVTEFTEPIEN